MISQKQLLELRAKVDVAFAESDRLDRLFEEFMVESGGSYDADRFSKWYRRRLYSEDGLRMLAKQESKRPDK